MPSIKMGVGFMAQSLISHMHMPEDGLAVILMSIVIIVMVFLSSEDNKCQTTLLQFTLAEFQCIQYWIWSSG